MHLIKYADNICMDWSYSKELIFRKKYYYVVSLALINNISQVEFLNILGITFQSNLGVDFRNIQYILDSNL